MDVSNWSLLLLVGIFVVAAAAIWLAGVHLSDTTDVLSKRFGLGQALGGMIVLAIVTNLPEIAITVSASLQGNTELAVGNILGGIAIQTVVLVVLDAVGVGKKGSLTGKADSLQLVMEGLLVIAVLTIVVIGRQLPSSLIFFRVTPTGILLLVTWIVGLWLVNKARKNLPWVSESKAKKGASDNNSDNGDDNGKNKGQSGNGQKKSTGKTVAIFLVAALVTLVAGYALEKTGDALSKQLGMQGIIFGATVLAAATSLPELSTGLASVKLKAYSLAVSDIFGGNAFLPVLFLVAAICSGKAVLPAAKNSDIYLAGLAMLLTVVYVCGVLFKPGKQVWRMGIDSFVVMIIYILGVVGLFVVAQ